jgi:hypothetical protein
MKRDLPAFINKNKRANAIRQLEQLRRGEIITEQEVKELCTKAREILIDESNVQRVDAPVTVNTFY